MTYTNKEYAEMAIEANEQGKLLVDNGGVLELHDIVQSAEEITASNQSIIASLIIEANAAIDKIKLRKKHNRAKDGDEEKQTEWEVYLLDLDEVDTSIEEMELPQKPS